MAKTKLGMDEETYRQMLQERIGVSSCSKASDTKLRNLWQWLQPQVNRGRSARGRSKNQPLAPQLKFAFALWNNLATAKVVEDASFKAFAHWAKVWLSLPKESSLGNASSAQQSRLCEYIKQWCNRTSTEY